MKTIAKTPVVVCFLVFYAVCVCAVIEKTREDDEHRRHVFLRNRTDSKPHHSTKRPTESKHEVIASTSPAPIRFHGPIRSPARIRNHRLGQDRMHSSIHGRPERKGYLPSPPEFWAYLTKLIYLSF